MERLTYFVSVFCEQKHGDSQFRTCGWLAVCLRMVVRPRLHIFRAGSPILRPVYQCNSADQRYQLTSRMWHVGSKLINLARRGVMTSAMTPAQRAAFSESEVLLATSESDSYLSSLESDGRRVDLAVPGFALALHHLPLHYLSCLSRMTPLVCPKFHWLSAPHVPHRLCSLSEQGRVGCLPAGSGAQAPGLSGPVAGPRACGVCHLLEPRARAAAALPQPQGCAEHGGGGGQHVGVKEGDGGGEVYLWF